MSIVKVGQNFTLTLDTSVALAAATTLRIDHKDPNGGTGQRNASVVDSTKARANFTATEMVINGEWKFQVYVVLSGAIYISGTFKQLVSRNYD